MTKTEDDIAGAIIGICAGIFLGMLGTAILDSLSGPKCPNCNHKVETNALYCNYCNTYLRWN